MLDALKAIDSVKKKEEKIHGEEACKSLRAAIKIWMKTWPPAMGQHEYLRASGMYDLCPREFVLHYWRPTANKSFSPDAHFKMSTGTHLHAYLQDLVLGPMGVLKGVWYRVDEAGKIAEEQEGYHPDPDRAVWDNLAQRDAHWKFKEQVVRDEQLRIVGHTDGEVSLEKIEWLLDNEKLVITEPKKACTRMHSLSVSEKTALLEIKTVSSYGFKGVKTSEDLPPYYKMQAEVYQKLSNNKSTLFWYIDRDSMSSHTFMYKFTGGWWKDARRKAVRIWKAIRDETLPEDFACPTQTCARAKRCAQKEPCFKKGLNFKGFIEYCKKQQPERKWLDLSTWKEPKK